MYNVKKRDINKRTRQLYDIELYCIFCPDADAETDAVIKFY